MFTLAFWKATAQRVVRSFAASMSSLLVADGTGILDTDWANQFSVAGMAAVVTLFLCLAAETFTDGAGPAFGSIEVTSPPAAPVDGGNQRGQITPLVAVLLLAVVAVVLILCVAT